MTYAEKNSNYFRLMISLALKNSEGQQKKTNIQLLQIIILFRYIVFSELQYSL